MLAAAEQHVPTWCRGCCCTALCCCWRKAAGAVAQPRRPSYGRTQLLPLHQPCDDRAGQPPAHQPTQQHLQQLQSTAATKASVQVQSATSPNRRRRENPHRQQLTHLVAMPWRSACSTITLICMFLSTLAVLAPAHQPQPWGKPWGKQPCRAASAAPWCGPHKAASWQPQLNSHLPRLLLMLQPNSSQLQVAPGGTRRFSASNRTYVNCTTANGPAVHAAAVQLSC